LTFEQFLKSLNERPFATKINWYRKKYAIQQFEAFFKPFKSKMVKWLCHKTTPKIQNFLNQLVI